MSATKAMQKALRTMPLGEMRTRLEALDRLASVERNLAKRSSYCQQIRMIEQAIVAKGSNPNA